MAIVVTGYACLPPAAIAASTTPPQPVKEKRVAQAASAAHAAPAAQVDFPTIVERYGPAVVNISTTGPQQQTSAPATQPIDIDDPIFVFFKRMATQPQSQDSSPRAMSGTGSGFIVSSDGLILTTAHVVDQAEALTVRLTDRREFKAKVLAVDAQSDVAVLQIEGTKLPTVKLGDSSRVRVGEQVMTIGSPDSFENTVTAGLVSATSRMLPDGSTFPFIQTDVSVNPDNSGGPVFNRAGEVVGIHVQIYADGDRYPSLTFAIPINLAIKVEAQVQSQLQAQLQSELKVSPGGLGVEVQDVGPGLAAAFGLTRPAGALVNTVGPGTPAAASGLKAGDVIVQIGDKPIDRSAELAEDAAALPPGTKAALKVVRNRRPMLLTVVIGTSGKVANAGTSQASGADRLGLIMHPLSEDERRTIDLAVGLMVDEVHEPAASAGIQPGDIVLSLNDTLVESQEQVTELEARAGKVVAVLIQRNHARSFVSVKLR
ncbi:trypsin-like peptidase domain-containing protein [Paraburkholderia sp. BL10I2N1]|uniref:trypsin-like peptidase domain-containing protein n=1 Tax=Paraburkholderia sp. BL10I2N1 TaxID=1938796 RepID=UPI00105CDDAB|nr:trypsin-like peptidase domain-containing protein [Paraburkholderia sp. BL10I2N1]